MILNKILNERKDEINEILHILKNCCFKELDERFFELCVVDTFHDRCSFDFNFETGATKGVLIFKNLGFVIKIPLMVSSDDVYLNGAIESINEWDYCEQELNRYEAAQEEGFGDIFLEIQLLTEIKNYPIYIQPYADIMSSLNSEQYKNNHKSNMDINNCNIIRSLEENNHYNYLNVDWEADLYTKYGKETFLKFKKYIQDNMIDDLTCDNIGYIGKNPVLVDYARI